MTTPLYDLSCMNYLQSLHATAGFLDKGLEYLREAGIDPEEVVTMRLYGDMLPFRYQVQSVAHHAAVGLEAVMTGSFRPPTGLPEEDYAALQRRVDDAIQMVKAVSVDEVNSRAGADIEFKLGERVLPFIAEDFVQTFSLPNVHFHAATAYGMLRARGAPLGKRDFIGLPRMKT